MSETPSQNCVCGHSPGAHRGSPAKCAFCHCLEFRDPRYVIQPPKHLNQKAVEALDLLAHAPAFHGVPEATLVALADKGERHLLMADDLLIQQGDPADALYLIVRGHVSIERRDGGRRERLREMGPGEVVGEMGVLDGSPRRADVIAQDDLEVIRISSDLMKETFREMPATLMAVVRLMNERLGKHRPG